jgi:dihydrofolate synthase/folylpolyglutamate synthase
MNRHLDYESAMNYLHGLYRFGSRLGLGRIRRLTSLLGNPERRFPSVHVAGTNGKGSVTAMVANVLRESGYRVGMYISPFLQDFEERMSINGENIPRERVAELASRARVAVERMLEEGHEHPTEFEVITAMAFQYFAEEGVDFGVIEVGLGGRYDATNVVTPWVSVITSIGFDHMDRLGNTIAKIAYEKAGIIKSGVPVVSSRQPAEALAVISQAAQENGSRLVRVGEDVEWREVRCSIEGQSVHLRGLHGSYENLDIALLGRHQQGNAATAVAALEVLSSAGVRVPEHAVRRGLATVKWPGRLEVISRSPLIVIDGAHNQDGARVLAAAIRDILPHDRMVLVIGILADKALDDILVELVPPAAHVIVTTPKSPRAYPADKLAEKVREYPVTVHVKPRISDALEKGLELTGPSDLLCVTGSLYLVGDARSKLGGFFQPDMNIHTSGLQPGGSRP